MPDPVLGSPHGEAHAVEERMNTSFDSDDANTSTARVHLGAFAAIETARVLPAAFETPARPVQSRTRKQISSSEKLKNGDWNAENLVAEDSGPAYVEIVDENELLLEEPSSVLGSRIMRALDNPSPPPQISVLPSLNDETEEHPLLVDIDLPPPASTKSTSPSRPVIEGRQTDISPFTGGPNHFPGNLYVMPPLPSLGRTPKAETSLGDLMTFESPAVVVRAESHDEHMISDGIDSQGPKPDALVLEQDKQISDLTPPELDAVELTLNVPTGNSSTTTPPFQSAVDTADVEDMLLQPEGSNRSSSPAEAMRVDTESFVESTPLPTAALERLSLSPKPSRAQSPPRVRRSARLSATPRTPPLNIVKRRSKRASSPLKESAVLISGEIQPSTPEHQSTPMQLPPLPRGLHIVKKADGRTISPGVGGVAASVEGIEDKGPTAHLLPPSSAQTRRKGKARTNPLEVSLISDDEEVDFSDSSMLLGLTSPEKRERRRTREQDIPNVDQRLGSLSPSSVNVVDTLVPGAVGEMEHAPPLPAPDFSAEAIMVDTPTEPSPAPIPATPQRPTRVFSIPTQVPLAALAGSRIVTSPARVASPTRPNATTNGDGPMPPPRTPVARRVPVSETIYAGTPMAQAPRTKTVAAGAHVSSKMPPPSPALLHGGIPARKPVRIPLRQASPSEVVQETESAPPLVAPPSLSAVTEDEPSSTTDDAVIVASSSNASPVKPTRPASKPSGLPVPAKSTLRKGSPGATSKIPRIGGKPYSRQRPTPTTSNTATFVAKGKTPSRKPTSDAKATPQHPTTSPEENAETPVPASAKTQTDASNTLKRKRSGENSAPAETRPASQKIVRVAPAMGTRGRPTPTLPKPASGQRRVAPATQRGPQRLLSQASSLYVELDDEDLQPTPEHATSDPAEEAVTATPPPSSPPEPAIEGIGTLELGVDSKVPNGTATELSHPEGNTWEPNTLAATPPQPVRRTSRGRKSIETDDASLAPPLAPSKPAPTKRRATTKPHFGISGGPFEGMTDLALKSLTLANTTRNQRYFASLETAVVRRMGDRPESPGMKIKTIAQRERDERGERAARRARRGSGASEGDEDVSMTDESGALLEFVKHRRGAGEDEDYETPVKGEPLAKRARFADVENKGGEGRKGVRWDRALFTEAWLDEIVPNPKKLTEVTTKGCLTPAAKGLRLDSLGNLINTDTPFNDLPQVNIVVQKFVYDNDAEAEPQPAAPPPPPPPPPKRSTRSRKSKS